MGKVSMAITAVALLTVLVAATAWFSFNQVVVVQRQIISETVPAIELARGIAQVNTSALALVEQLASAQSLDEVESLTLSGKNQFKEAHRLLALLHDGPIAFQVVNRLDNTLNAIETNLEQQAQVVRSDIQTRASAQSLLLQQQQAVNRLMLLAESLAANASTSTTATIASIYPMLQGTPQQSDIQSSLDRLIEVDVDRMERMSEFQMVCFRLNATLEKIGTAQDDMALQALSKEYAADLKILTRRIQDFRDPSRQKEALNQYARLTSAPEEHSLFAMQRQRNLNASQWSGLRQEGASLAKALDAQGAELLQASSQSIERDSAFSRAAISRGAIGFMVIGVLLLSVLLVTLWFLLRYDIFERLKGIEGSIRAFMTGNYQVRVPASERPNDPLAPLVQALEQFREHAQARQKAEATNQAQNEFLGTLSHELRTPLSGISGSVQLLRDTVLDERQLEYLRMIAYANATLLEILEDMLGFSRLEAGKTSLDVEVFSLTDTLDDMLSLQMVTAMAKGVAIVRDLPEGLPDRLIGDRRKLNQVLLNTIGNAIKFTDEGEITVSVKQLPSGTPPTVRLRFSISDTGIGIPPDQLKKVFDPFYQVEETAHRRHGGTGLGLAICQRLVELMGGTISIQSEWSEGTTVSFELPFEAAPDLSVSASKKDQTSLVCQPLTVLVVEDDEINRIVCGRYLESLGHQAVLAEDGHSGLQTLEHHTGTIDAVLMDISLPGASGYDVAMAMHQMQQGRWKNLPIIGMSAHVSPDTFDQSKSVGMAGFLSKPFQRAQLAHMLSEVVTSTKAVSLDAAMRTIENESLAHATQTDTTPDHATLLDLAYLSKELEALGPAMLAQLAHMFDNEAQTAVQGIQDSLDAQDFERAGKLAHKLRSAAGNLGLTQVMVATRTLEQACKTSPVDTALIQTRAAAIVSDCSHSIAALKQWLGQQAA